MKSDVKVLVTIPNTGWIHKRVVYCLLKLQHDRRYKLRFIMPTHSPLENNQHHIINDFMKGGEDYWLSIDSDNPPIQNPLDLVDFDKDVMGLPTPVWHYEGKKGERPIYWNVYKQQGVEGYKEWKEKRGLQKVDAIGMGCFLIARRVFENPHMRRAPFTRKLNYDGTVDRGNDISFCERASENGFQIWAHYDYPCMHFSELELTEVIKAFQ